MDEVSFPRGRPARSVSPDADRSRSKGRDHKRSGDNKKERSSDAAARDNTDFLFGSADGKRRRHDDAQKKKKRRKSEPTPSSTKQSLLPLGGGAVIHSVHKKKGGDSEQHTSIMIESLSFGKLAKGMKLLAVCREVHDDLAVFCLPNLWTGYMLPPSNSDFGCSEMVQRGQMLSVAIVKMVEETVGNQVGSNLRRRIQVSCMPEAVNARGSDKSSLSVLRGQVLTVEDHGLVIDVGWGRRGFLAFTDIHGEYSVDESDDEPDAKDSNGGEHEWRLAPGRLLDFTVLKGKKSSASIIPLCLPSREEQVREELLASMSTPPTLQQLLPGTLVRCKVEAIARNGLCVTFGNGVFRGAMEVRQLGALYVPDSRTESTGWKDVFDKHRSLLARIIAVDPVTKIVRLSRLPHVLELRGVPGDNRFPSKGTVVKDCTVIRVDAGAGALLALPSTDNDLPETESDENEPPGMFPPLTDSDEEYQQATRVQAVYVHISKAIDSDEHDGKTPESVFAKAFAPSTKHDVRIMNTSHWMDGIASGATASSIVSAQVTSHADLEPGKVFHQVPVCAQLNGGGILVDFGLGVRGMIPSLHLFEQGAASSTFRDEMRKVKYAVGTKVDVRVLTVDAATRKCKLTAKKSLVKADHVITSFDDIKAGQRGTGFVSKVDDQGLIVTFFGDVYGRVTARSLTTELGVEDHKENYNVGDVVDCRVTNIKKKRDQRDKQHDEADETRPRRTFWELTLSLNVDLDTSDITSSRRVHIRVGAVLPLKSIRIVKLVKGKEKENGGFVPGYAVVRIASKYLVDEREIGTVAPFIECKLSYEHLMDEYLPGDIESAAALDALAEESLTEGKKVNRKGVILTDPSKTCAEYAVGTGQLIDVTVRPKIIEFASKRSAENENDSSDLLLPGPDTPLYQGARLLGYVAQVDPRHGAFVRFLGGRTGLVPKIKGGLDFPLFGTVVTRIVTLDVTARPPRMLLSKDLSSSPGRVKGSRDAPKCDLKVGDTVEQVEIVDVNFHRAKVKILDSELGSTTKIQARVHYTMAGSKAVTKPVKKDSVASEQVITSVHPFNGWKKGTKLSALTVVAVDYRAGMSYIELSNRKPSHPNDADFPVSAFFEKGSQLSPGLKVSGIVSSCAQKGGGVWVQLSPDTAGFVPALELSSDLDVLDNLQQCFPNGMRLNCVVLDRKTWTDRRSKLYGTKGHQDNKVKRDTLFLSVLACSEEEKKTAKPVRGDVVLGCINRHVWVQNAPALMLDLRGGFIGRCCITELEEVGDWSNMPLGHGRTTDNEGGGQESAEAYHHGKFVKCRVLAGVPSKPLVEVSLRQSRIHGDLDDDPLPKVDDTAQAFVADTNPKGCFLRLARHVEGRVTLKELCDGFLPNPAASFPMGRLVVGKVKRMNKAQKKKALTRVDLDMRESTLLDAMGKLQYSDVQVGSKYKGTVTRLEKYGVFVRINGSDLSGLAHKSECSDKYIKNLSALYDPGDLVKVLVVEKDSDKKQLGFSLKASHFVDDESSDSDSSSDEEADKDKGKAKSKPSKEEVDSDDENFVSKLALQVEPSAAAVDDEKSDSDNDQSGSSDSETSSTSSSDSDESDKEEATGIDTNVGFNWSGEASERTKRRRTESMDNDDDSSEGEEEEGMHKSSHKSRRKQAQRRREEKEISRREMALADGTADGNPETAGDFERLLAGNPNSSELWIRYMAFHLALADIPAARDVAERAFERIEFRQEGEKLNVWSALLNLELKFGSTSSLEETLDLACQCNNPKQVYLRMCEMMEKHAEQAQSSSSSSDWASRTDEMCQKMCKKFRDKKTVWIAYVDYLLRKNRHEDAHSLSKRALQSLPPHKHVEVMSKFAQLVFQYDSAERARTLFDGLLQKCPKRLDLFFVYVDKELKHGGGMDSARALFQQTVAPYAASSSGSSSGVRKMKLSDRQMKSLFKKWFRLEEQYGTEATQEEVKKTARNYVERSNA